jgi:diphthamide synthase subunit DPH2
MVEGDVRADTIRHIGRSVPPTQHFSDPVRFVPTRPPLAETAHGSRPTPQWEDDENSSSGTAVDEADAAALT